MGLFERRADVNSSRNGRSKQDIEMTPSNARDGISAPEQVHKKPAKHHTLPVFNHKGHKVTKGIQPDGESGRRGFHPLHFFKITWRSTSDASRAVNVLWPVVPAAIAVRYALPENHLLIFILNYIAMVPCANLIGFAGQEFARKLPKVFGVITETTLGSVVEIVLFMVLLSKDRFQVIQAAILGSILATQLLCLGACFFIGGLTRDEQEFDPAVSEVGSGLLLVAGFGLIIPSAFKAAVHADSANLVALTTAQLDDKVLHISRISAVMLIVAYATYLWFQMHTHHGIYDTVLELDEQKDADRQEDLEKHKLTLTECILALAVAIALVTLIAIALVEQISFIVEDRGVSDSFIGLILIPLVEKAAEHLTAVDEAYDNQMNFALSHILGATIQTALFNAPLVVIVGWGLNKEMGFTFQIFDVIVLILSILVVGNFLQDQKSNYLEGALCVIVYMIIAVAAFYFPNPLEGGEEGGAEGTEGAGEAVAEAVARSVRLLTG